MSWWNDRKRHAVALRLAADAALFFAVYLAPWWLIVVLALVFIFAFRSYLEAIIAGTMYDLLFGVPLPALYHIPALMTGALSLALIGAWYAKRLLIVYDER